MRKIEIFLAFLVHQNIEVINIWVLFIYSIDGIYYALV